MDSKSLGISQALDTSCAILSVVAVRAYVPGLCQGELRGHNVVGRGWSEKSFGPLLPVLSPSPCWKLYDKTSVLVESWGLEWKTHLGAQRLTICRQLYQC